MTDPIRTRDGLAEALEQAMKRHPSSQLARKIQHALQGKQPTDRPMTHQEWGEALDTAATISNTDTTKE